MAAVKSQDSKSRGRPRSAAAQTAILEAAAQLIAAGGIGAVTMEAVARRAGVGKPTVYRNWASREELAMAALLKAGAPRTGVKDTGSALDDLNRQLLKVAQAFATPRGRNAALMVASADPDSELSKAFRNQVMLASREEGRAILKRAIAGRCVRRDANIDVALDMIYGPIFYRLQIGHAPVDGAFIQDLMSEAMRGLRPEARKWRSTLP
jgi:AcrR family transcriptional regulator